MGSCRAHVGGELPPPKARAGLRTPFPDGALAWLLAGGLGSSMCCVPSTPPPRSAVSSQRRGWLPQSECFHRVGWKPHLLYDLGAEVTGCRGRAWRPAHWHLPEAEEQRQGLLGSQEAQQAEAGWWAGAQGQAPRCGHPSTSLVPCLSAPAPSPLAATWSRRSGWP